MSRWDTNLTLAELFEAWLNDARGTVDDGTLEMRRDHARAHLVPFFADPHSITSAKIASYSRDRLRKVIRRTLQKERSTLRSFLGWCHEQSHLTVPPEFPLLPKRAAGTPYEKRRRGKPTELSPEESMALIGELPKYGRTRDGVIFPIQDRFRFAYLTTLRWGTINKLSCPEHYAIGGDVLIIEDRMDKARFGREYPLTPEVKAILERVARRGLIFGCFNYRRALRKAAKAALSPEKARTFNATDLRVARATELAEKGNLPGLQYILGHRQVTTTAIYVKPGMRAAKRVLGLASWRATRTPGDLVALRHLCVIPPTRAKSETRTRTPFRAPEPESGEQNPLLSRALELLQAASGGGEPPSIDERTEFIRDVLMSTDVGRLALGALDGDFALANLVRLAELVVEDQSDKADASAKKGTDRDTR